jgi:hypothetical protein
MTYTTNSIATGSYTVTNCCNGVPLGPNEACCPNPFPGPVIEEPYNTNTHCCTAFGVTPKHGNSYADLILKCPGRTHDPNHAVTQNGCGPPTFAVNCPPLAGVCFTSACNGHDLCYGTCSADPDHKTDCDNQFLLDMDAICVANGQSDPLSDCQLWANFYYSLVASPIGTYFYQQAQEEDCICCP